MRVEDVPRPGIAKTELLVKVAVCAVCGSDVRTFRHGARNISRPVVLGHEISGTVEEIGAQLSGFTVGQRVAVAPAIPCGECRYCRRSAETMCEQLRSIGYEFDGGLAEFLAVPASAVRAGCVNRVPDHVSFAEAATAEPLACVINAQELTRVGEGDTVAVVGAGPVGCLHAGLARVRGAAKTMLIDVRPERLKLAAPFGADVFIDASREDVRNRVLDETDGHGASVVIIAAPSNRAQEQSVTLAARRGRINFFGGLPKTNPIIALDANIVHYRELSIIGSYGSRPAHNRMALDLIASGQLRTEPLIGLELPLDRIVDGLQAIEEGRVLKVIVRP
jgi:L-iditol 2-dehydrogenase